MKGVKFWTVWIGWLICGCPVSAQETVWPGIAAFEEYGVLLQGKRVALAANQTSVVVSYRIAGIPETGENMQKPLHTLDFLREKGVNVVKIFCPEHGFRGDADAGERVGDGRDARTGLPVISLYGKKKKPAPEDLKDVDVVVFDMQDVGVRFYTYLSTLHYLMEACAENGIPLLLADRPNPNAFYVDGPVLEKNQISFVGMHPVPVVYGMTIGEYAGMINGEGWLKGGVRCELKVIPCRNWQRDQIVILPCRPSPNLPDALSVILYPSVCFFEGTVVNEGRGTRTPFQVFGHPDLQNMPYAYVPESIPGMSKSPKCMGQTCYGMDLRNRFEEVRRDKKLRLDWLLTAYRNYSGKESFFTAFFDKLAGTSAFREAVSAGKNEHEIRRDWQEGLQNFQSIRAKYLRYR